MILKNSITKENITTNHLLQINDTNFSPTFEEIFW